MSASGEKTLQARGTSQNYLLTVNRVPNIDHLHIDTRIDRRVVPIGDVLVFVPNGNGAGVFNDVNSAAKIKGKVESCSSRYRHILGEKEKPACAAS